MANTKASRPGQSSLSPSLAKNAPMGDPRARTNFDATRTPLASIKDLDPQFCNVVTVAEKLNEVLAALRMAQQIGRR